MRIRALALLAVVALVLGACGDDDGDTTTDTTDGTTTTSESTSSTSSESSTTSEPDAETIDLSVYFLDESGQLRMGWEREIVAPAVAEGVLESLLRGITDEDEELGLSTAIPEGTILNSVDIAEDGTGTVDLSAEFAAGGDEASARARLAQVVYVMTQFPTVEQVEIVVDGQPLTSVGDAGVAVDGPMVRADFQWGGTYEGPEGFVLAETPRPGATIEGPTVDVGGSANTFEATVYLEATDAAGNVLVPEEFTTATSGSGTPGTFYTTLSFPDGTTGEVVIRVYDVSAEDGSRRSVNELPITLN
jgi:germination protein M